MNKLRHTLAVAVPLLLASPAAWAGAPSGKVERCLADEGRSDYRIVIAQEAPPSTRYAAEELQTFFLKITGVRLPIVVDTEPPQDEEIVVGRSRRLDAIKPSIDLDSLGKEGYVLRTLGRRLAIVGGEPRGTLYGVYGLLEDHFGCRWFTPELERIPRIARVPLPELDERHAPAFEYRETYLWETCDGNWMARSRRHGIGGRGRAADRWGVHSPAPRIEARHGGGIAFGSGFFVHSMELVMPREQYFAEHPEYYSLRDGKREPYQLCCTNKDVIRLCTEAVRKAMREQSEATVFSLSQNDNRNYCQCQRCQALAAAEESQMAPVLQLVNRVAEAVEKEFPDKVVETLAYTWTRKAPKSMRPRPNVVIRLCDIECCFSHPLASGCSEKNDAFVADLQAWSKVCDRLWIRDYVTDFRNYLLPFPNKRVIDDNLRLFAANHVTGVFEQDTWNSADSELASLGAYLMAKLLWEPNYGENRAINEFLDAYYGRAAWPVRQYLDLLHDYAEGRQIHCGCYTPVSSKHLTTPLLRAADGLWAEAEKLVHDDPAVLDHVQRSRMSVDYAIVERAREGLKVPEDRRGPELREVIALARTRLGPLVATLGRSPITKVRESRGLEKDAYIEDLRQVLQQDR